MAKRKVRANGSTRKKGDDTYNARRRYVRDAQRKLDQAESATGATAARLRRLAQESYKKALQTYTDVKQKISKPIQDIGARLGIDPKRQREQYAQAGQDIGKLEQQSFEFTQAGLAERNKQARIREAETLFNSPIGKRVIGGLEGIWREPATMPNGKVDKLKILPALYDYFGVDNQADLLEKIESVIGERLYKSDGGEQENYDTVKLAIQTAIAHGAFVV